jgi:ATP-dependent 26S proteasome regulatory subunit
MMTTAAAAPTRTLSGELEGDTEKEAKDGDDGEATTSQHQLQRQQQQHQEQHPQQQQQQQPQPQQQRDVPLSRAAVASLADQLCVGYVIADFFSLVREALLTRVRTSGGASLGTSACTSTSHSNSNTANSSNSSSRSTFGTNQNKYLTGEELELAARHVHGSLLRTGLGNASGIANSSSANSSTSTSTSTSTSSGTSSAVWDAIGGLESVKLQLQQSVQWPVQHAQAFSRLGVTPQRGVLLHGPPGCAKTTLVRALASTSGAAFVALSSADVYSPFVGEAEAIVRRCVSVCVCAYPCVLVRTSAY